ncbi:helix-turn-helix transcriptional regulator [Streptomyces sp. IB2014 016-6]|uniref:helix-turn-helix domain-containing protein n=1 Tax=Streptomyces sp. IB2014 016-6 TaxID=2517818 RepID=UPI0011CC5337|nr:helix-turn-helix transcriptional regulator [Streptomyces sp. IB2014 016-6]TXL90498.1 XRE family transcriptional regulator [Streptomyces sp. IB2014 016-6]
MATTEARAFAELLSELKERSGRSYGVLAAKLHVSTSTLHRYCNGDAVPADFSAAERFGRLCGATGEEFVELHRRWILADEARRRSRAAGPTAASAEEPPAPAPPATAPGTEPAAAPVAPVAPVEPVESADAATPEPERPEGDTSASRRRKRLYVTLAAAAVVVAVAVPALVFGPLNDPSTDRSSTASEVSDGGGSKSPEPSVSPSGSPSPDKSPSPKASSSARETAKDKADGGDQGKGKEEAGGVPVTVNTRPYAFEDPCTQRYLVDRPASEVPPPPSEPDAPGWVAALGAVSSGSQFIELALQGTGSETVVLNDMNVRVVGSDAPLAWNDFGTGVGCGGGVTTRAFTVDLDAGRPGVEPQGGQRDFPYKVSESDPEVFHITAKASARYVSWYLELEWSSGGREGTLRIDDHGKPFRTSGAQGRPSFDYPLGGDSKWETAAVNDPDQYP